MSNRLNLDSDWHGLYMRTGKRAPDRQLVRLEREVKALREQIAPLEAEVNAKLEEASAIWSEHAPWYVDGDRVRGGNSGGWE